jgi:hypothetical protein
MADCKNCPHSVDNLSQGSPEGHTIYGSPQAVYRVQQAFRELEDAKALLRKANDSVENLLKEFRARRLP